MTLDITFRSAEMQAIYQEAMQTGESEDITKIKSDGFIGGLKILNDRYPPDLLMKDVYNFIGEVGKDWEAFIRFGILYFNDELPYDGFWLNSKSKMSQPKAWHIKGVNMDEDKIKFHRLCATNREKIERFLNEH